MLTHVALPAQGAEAARATVQATLHAAVGTADWADELGGQLTWMAHQGVGSASLHVSPADLGPIEVRITVHANDASVWFGAAQADTRAALQQALPRLRELFAAQGMALADTGVFREPPREAPQRGATAAAPSGSADAGIERTQAVSAPAHATVGLVDLYA